MSQPLMPRMVHEYYVARLRAVAAAHAKQRERVRTRRAALALRAEVRRRLRACFGTPPPRTPLNARVTATVSRSGYRIENVLYDSRPGFTVSANLYVPAGDGPFPVVLGACGHAANGKAEPKYQAFATGLVRRGYMVLVYDPLSQGERCQLTEAVGNYKPGNCCHEHNIFGNRLHLLGEFFGAWRAWDGIRGLDYLLARPEADAARVGVTGNSGGGTLTTYISTLDDRVTMAAPSCFITTQLCNLENELPADSEQTPPGLLAAGLDMADYFVAQMPRPVLLLGQRNDFFDTRGLRQTYEELRRLYGLLGAADRVRLFIGHHGHGFHPENREAMYAFFGEWAGRPARVRPSESRTEKDETLLAAPGGSVLNAGARNMTELLKERAETVRARRKPLDAAALRRAIGRALALPKRTDAPHHRALRGGGEAYGAHSLFLVDTEPGIQAVLHLFARDGYAYLPGERKATLYVPHVDAVDDIRSGAAPKTRPLYAVDLRGTGCSMPRTCGSEDFFHPYGSDYMYAAHGDMLGEPYLGRRTHDLLSVLDLLGANGCAEVHLVGRGLGALPATFAACLHPLVKRVTLRHAPRSYHAMLAQPVAQWPRSVMAHGLLRRFDLPDCYALLRREKRLRLEEAWDHLMG